MKGDGRSREGKADQFGTDGSPVDAGEWAALVFFAGDSNSPHRESVWIVGARANLVSLALVRQCWRVTGDGGGASSGVRGMDPHSSKGRRDDHDG